jgi:hypothetical protein
MTARSLALLAVLTGSLLLLGAGPAAADPAFNLDLHHVETNFPPGTPGTVTTDTVTNGAAPSTDEVQRISVVATAGQFKLSFGGHTTGNIAVKASNAQVESALGALPSIGPGNVSVGGGPTSLAPYQVTFTGALASTDAAQLSVEPGTAPLLLPAEITPDIINVGDAPTAGPITLNLTLPTGMTLESALPNPWEPAGYDGDTFSWNCTGSGNVTCTSNAGAFIPRRWVYRGLRLGVNVSPSVATGDRFVQARVSGGGASPAPAAAACPIGAAACAIEAIRIDPDPVPFQIIPDTYTSDFYESDGVTPVRQAGAHPDLFTTVFDFGTNRANLVRAPRQRLPEGAVRNIRANLPPGFFGDPSAIPECTHAQFVAGDCPGSTQVGRFDARVMGLTLGSTDSTTSAGIVWGVYNIEHPHGSIADLGFTVAGQPVHIRARLDPANNYAVTATVPDINPALPVFDQRLTLWGVPADPSHDAERCEGFNGLVPLSGGITTDECPAGVPRRPFLTAPFDCAAGSHSMGLYDYDSWQAPGVFGPDLAYDLPGQFTGCEAVPFAPTVSIAPTTDAADSPSGLDVRIDLPQDEDPDDIATSPLKDATVTLPEGLTVNPASANGLAACTPAQISLGTNDPVRCPEASKIADAQVTTVLPEPVEGTVYLATPHDNPFGSLLAGYIVLSDSDLGLLVKIPGRIDVDPATGQITGTFKDNPQLPFSEFELHFKGGAHSSLITPKTCGDYTSSAEFSPWSGNPAVQPTDSFAITQVPGGGACPGSEADLPNSPGFDAGTVSPISKNFSPFVLHLRREDGSQRFSALNVSLPPGMTGKLAGAKLCSEVALAAVAARSGNEEKANPFCPLDSRVGAVHAAVGAGPSPYNASGVAYLAGPYRGAPVSIATIVPAVAGPFDLGNVVVRAPVFVDPRTAKLSTTTDPFPEMLEGIPLDVRSVSVVMDRPEFTLTGTSCDPSSVDGLLTSTLGQTALLSVRYQLSDCGRLPFKPRMSLSLRGGTKRGRYPALTINLMPRAGDANIASVSVALPRSEFLANEHIRTVCTRPDFAADNCPAGAIYGEASVDTPLLDYDLAGRVYLRSSDNLLPDVVPDLRGPAHQPIKLETSGRTDSIKGGIRTMIDFVPDAPFTKAVVALQGAGKGLLVNSRDICGRVYRATVRYTAHNGATYVDHPKLRAKCGRGKRGKRGKRGGHERSRAVTLRSAVK